MQKTYFTLLCTIAIFITTVSYGHCGRPLITEDAPTVGKGNVEVEAGFERVKEQDGARERAVIIVINYGLADNLDLNVEKPFGNIHPGTGARVRFTADTFYSLKYRFVEEGKSTPAMGIRAYVDSADGCSCGTSGDTEYGAMFFLQKGFKGITIQGNLNYQFTNPGVFGYSASFEKPLGGKFELAGEFAQEYVQRRNTLCITQAGLRYELSPSVILDAGYVFGLNRHSPKNAYTVGATIVF